MRISRMIDQEKVQLSKQGIWIEYNSASKKKPPLDALEHRVRRKKDRLVKPRKRGSS
jgi:hypothetical protein